MAVQFSVCLALLRFHYYKWTFFARNPNQPRFDRFRSSSYNNTGDRRPDARQFNSFSL